MGVNGRSNLSFDANSFLAAFCSYLQESMTQMELMFIEIMSEEIDNYTDNAGDPAWRADLKASLKPFNEQITESIISADVGIDEAAESIHTKMVGYVTAYGIGSRATTDGGIGERIYRGPPDREVWNGELDGKKTSGKEYSLLPDGFNQPGNNWVENACKNATKFFKDWMEFAMTHIPDSVFYGNVIVS